MEWKIGFHDDFDVSALPEQVRIEVVASARLLAEFGPDLGRPRVDTLKGSKFANMKELRFNAGNQVWRVAFAFDPSVRVSCWQQERNQGDQRRCSTAVSSPKLTGGSTNIWHNGEEGASMKPLQEVLDRLPKEEREAVEARARELITEEMTLRELRQACDLTQDQMGDLLEIGQDSISRLEKRSDLRLSTLRSYVQAMGGSLELTVKFPNRPNVVLSGIGTSTPSSHQKQFRLVR